MQVCGLREGASCLSVACSKRCRVGNRRRFVFAPRVEPHALALALEDGLISERCASLNTYRVVGENDSTTLRGNLD